MTLLVELLFGIVFVGTLLDYVRRRDPLAREVAFAFVGLASLLALDVIGRAGLTVPPIAGRVAFVLLLAQPLFTLRLLAEIRPLPRYLQPAAYLVSLATFLPLLVLPADSPLLRPTVFFAFGLFAVLGAIGAVYFVTEGRRRIGSARARLITAGVATALLAAAVLSLLVFSVAGGAAGETGAFVARVVATAAAVGYAAAFLPPPFLRRAWQRAAGYELGRELLETADATDPALAWHRFVEVARRLTGADAAALRGADGKVRAAVNVDPPPLRAEEVAPLLAGPRLRADCDPADIGPPWTSVAAGVGARFITVVRIEPRDAGAVPAALLLYSRRRSLFADDDRELVAALGAQASVLAERARLAADLRATNQQLRSASAAKSDFVASMSHELRTPLNAIIGFSELMRMESSGGGRASIPTEWIDHVAGAGQHLLDLINDVLDVSKVEAGRLELDPVAFDLDAAAREWIAGIRPLADRKRIRLRADGHAGRVVADRGRVRQIAYNLLSNAIKFTPEGGEVRLELDRDDSGVAISVVDSGVGIAPHDHAAVFEEFRQVGDPRDRQPGTGLGLALTRRLVEAHGGHIELESDLGRGARFTVRLPQDEAVEEALGVPVLERPEDVEGLEILVIEDDPSAVRLLREMLEGAGWAVRVAPDGEAGLALAREHRPDAIVLDVLLPGIDGWDVLRALKGDPDIQDVPVLIVTVVDEREVGMALGASDYLVKPVERSALLARLAGYTLTTKVREREVRVLVADDDPKAVDIVAAALEPEGFTVVRAYTGTHAMREALASPPDLVITDLAMPELDGFGLVAALKADPRTRDAPILVVTGQTLTRAEKDRLNGDILGIVEKGASLEEGLAHWLRSTARRRKRAVHAA